MLRRLVLGSFPQGVLSPPVANSVDFMVEQVDRRTLCLSAAFVNLFFLFRASKLVSIALLSQCRRHCSLMFSPQLEQLPRIDIASRLTLAATGYVQPQLISKQDIPVSLCDSG